MPLVLIVGADTSGTPEVFAAALQAAGRAVVVGQPTAGAVQGFETISLPDGSHIPIEQRTPTEVTHIGGTRIVPEGVAVFNPAFDVTPHEFVTAIVTEVGVGLPPYIDSLAKLAGNGVKA